MHLAALPTTTQDRPALTAYRGVGPAAPIPPSPAVDESETHPLPYKTSAKQKERTEKVNLALAVFFAYPFLNKAPAIVSPSPKARLTIVMRSLTLASFRILAQMCGSVAEDIFPRSSSTARLDAPWPSLRPNNFCTESIILGPAG